MNKSRIPKLTDIMAIVPAHVYGTGTVNAGRIYSGKRAVVLVLNEEYEEEREQTMSVSIERDNHTCIIMCTALEDYIKGDACSREGKILMQSIYNEITEKLKEAD